MRSSVFESNLLAHLEETLPPAAPGMQIQVHLQGKKVLDLSVGETFAYYDLASLTKIIFTVQAMIKAFEEGKWNLKSRVQEFCPWFPEEKILLVECLNHSSGLPWWLPFYENLDLSTSSLNRWTEAARIIRGTKIENTNAKSDVSIYSDVGFIVLGHVLESMYSLPLIEIWSKVKDEFYSRSTLDFNVENQPKNKAKFYAPTERCKWRNKVIQGEAHDDNTWAFGGVSSHAGLFGSIDDLGWVGIFLRSQLKGISRTAIRQKTAQLFAQRSRPVGKGDWALGYMMPTPGASSSGSHFSPYSIGHVGFTGTSLWYDPIMDVSIAILSNRVFYGRDKKDFALLRPQIHNWVMEGLKRV